jgi:hypothetical protein
MFNPRSNFKPVPKYYIKNILDDEIFNSDAFNKHVKQVSLNINMDEKTVKKVLVSYFMNIAFVLNTVRKIKTKINVLGFFSLIVRDGYLYKKKIKS